MPPSNHVEVRDIDGVRVLRLLDHQLHDDLTVRQTADALTAALPNKPRSRVVLDLSNVDEISSSMIGKLLILLRRMDATKGQLRLCELSPSVQGVLRATTLDRMFAIDRDLHESLDHLG